MTKKKIIKFLGVADFFQEAAQSYPVGGTDIFQLATYKRHIVYPGIISGHTWVILVSTKYLQSIDLNKWKIKAVDKKKNELFTAEFKTTLLSESEVSNLNFIKEENLIAFSSISELSIIHFRIDTIVSRPGEYTLLSIYDGKKPETIGSVHFLYNKFPSLTPDQIKAIEADPNAVKALRMDLGCKFCSKKLRVYTALARSNKLEKESNIWYADLDDEFECDCGKTKHELNYMKESMHGMLLKNYDTEVSGLSYIRQYGHQQIIGIINKFKDLLELENAEAPVQRFLEKNPILLSRFHAKRLFLKPGIIGRFEADFAILDSNKQLWFIELERPSMKLFKKDGHPTADLMHAYEQVKDWLTQYDKFSPAILSSLKLDPKEVVAVRGAVIAGRSKGLLHEVLQRHLTRSPYNIEFMTLDDLGSSLLQISKKLA